MSNYSIAMSGLDAAQKALDVIGNNIANAATEGYHRQRIELRPACSSQQGSVLLGGGVAIDSITRLVDNFLELEVLRQQSSLGQVSHELAMLRTIENAFGEFAGENSGLNVAIDKFFNTLQDLNADPTNIVWQTQAVSDADAMAGQFRTLGEFLTTLETQIGLEAENAIEHVNTLTSQIAELNNSIKKLEVGGAQANNLRDQRDRYILELSELVCIETQSREFGVVDVAIVGMPVVMGASAVELETGLDGNGSLGISIAGASNYTTNIQGGKLGAMLSLKNDIVYDIHNNLDSLATAIVQQINKYHVQGIGSEGSFTELTGWANTNGDLSDFTSLSDGTVYIRVTNTTTGEITRQSINIDADDNDAGCDTLTDVKNAIDAIAGLSASVNSSNQLTITADADYEFDFLPAVLPTATTTDFGEASPPTVTVSGIYTAAENQTFTFTVKGDGSVGNGTLELEVTDGDSNVVATVNVGSGYAAGDEINIGDTGIKIALSAGDLDETTEGDEFTVQALANTDTSGFLAAAGINTFFAGSSAVNMVVCSDISATPGRIATALVSDIADSSNVSRMVNLRNEAISSLGSLTCGEFYRGMTSNIGQQFSMRQIRQDNIEVMVQNLANQRSEISGVDINEEAAQLLIFEQMFQAMARYMNTIQTSVESLMQII